MVAFFLCSTKQIFNFSYILNKLKKGVNNMDREALKKCMICAHVWTKELIEQYGGDYHIQFTLCMRELIRQKKEGLHNLF